MKITKDTLIRFAGALWAVSTSYYALQTYYHVNTILWILLSAVLYIWLIRFLDRIRTIRRK